MFLLLPIGTDAPLKRRPTMNYVIVAVNVLFYLIFNTLAEQGHVESLAQLKQRMMLWPGNPTLLQFLTYQFLHADFMHLLGNMWFLWMFGNATNSKLGNVAYLLFYLAGGVFAGFGFALTETQLPCLGASGAVAAITTAYLALFPRSIIRMFYWIVWFIGDFEIRSIPLIVGKMILWDNILAVRLSTSVAMRSVAYEAHLAGYAFGFAAALLLLGVRAVGRDPFDILALWSRWRRRREFAAVAARTEAGAAGGVRGTPSPDMERTFPAGTIAGPDDRIGRLREQITRAVERFDLPGAAALYRKLIELDPDQVLPRAQQLDVANQLTAEGQYEHAAKAYEKLLQRYPTASEVPQVRFLLGVIYARHLGRYQEAAESLAECRRRLTDPGQIQQCDYWLQVVRGRLGGQDRSERTGGEGSSSGS